MSSTLGTPSQRRGLVGADQPDPARIKITAEPPVEQPFTGALHEVDRLARVQPGTVVVIFPPGEAPRLRHPGEMLMPGWSPLRYAAMALPVSTAVIPLRVVITELITLDGRPIEQVTLRVLVQICEDDNFAAVAALAAEFGDTFGSYLIHQLQSKIESGVRGAFRMNRLTDLRRQTVSQILDDRWLPLSYANGTLIRRGLTVIDVGWPVEPGTAVPSTADPSTIDPDTIEIIPAPRGGEGGQGAPTRVAAASNPGARTAPSSTGPRLELTLDARLRRVWRSGTTAEVDGIAGALVDREATIVAVCTDPPSAYDAGRLKAAFAELYGDPAACLVVISADDYPALVRSWLDQVDNHHVTAQEVESLRDDDLLRITLDRSLAPTGLASRGRPGPDGSEVEALRRLLPHRRVELAVVGR